MPKSAFNCSDFFLRASDNGKELKLEQELSKKDSEIRESKEDLRLEREKSEKLIDFFITLKGGAELRVQEGNHPFYRWMLDIGQRAIESYQKDAGEQGRGNENT